MITKISHNKYIKECLQCNFKKPKDFIMINPEKEYQRVPVNTQSPLALRLQKLIRAQRQSNLVCGNENFMNERK